MSSCGLRLIVFFLGSLAFLPLVHADSSSAAIPKDEQRSPSRVVPQKGVFLVAKPSMRDPRFQRTVVLLLIHEKDGTLGLIINRPTEIPVTRVLPDLPVPAEDEHPHVLFFGGPVGMNILLFLVRTGDALEQAAHVMADVYYSADKDTLEQLLKEQRGTGQLRMYVGHSGWAPGQLAAEIARGDWLLVRADAQTIFKKDWDNVWPDLIERRPPPGLIVDYPRGEIAAKAGLHLAGATSVRTQAITR